MDRLLTVDEVSRTLHIHSNSVRRWAEKGYLKCIRIGPRGDRRFREEDIKLMLAKFNSSSSVDTSLPLPIVVKLTDPQQEVLELIHKGRSNKQIAEELDISLTYVHQRIRVLQYKFGVGSRLELRKLGKEKVT